MQVQSVIEERSEMILLKASPLQSIFHSNDRGLIKPARQQWKNSTADYKIRQETDAELRLRSGSTFRVELTRDVEVVADTDDPQQYSVTFHQLVARCCRKFTVVPKPSVNTEKDPPKVSQSTKHVSVKRSQKEILYISGITVDYFTKRTCTLTYASTNDQ